MNYWLVKSEPSKYSWDQLMSDGRTCWDGVRNFQARNNLKAMRADDLVLFYHSNTDKAVVGIAKIIKEAYQDPTTKDADWFAVDLVPIQAMVHALRLDQIKSDELLKNIALVKQGRLSVMPLRAEEFDRILELGSCV